VMTLRVKNVES